MRFRPLEPLGVVLIEIDPIHDDRGFFARSFCAVEFAGAGLDVDFPQQNISHNTKRGTVRGMHYQTAPHAESKVVRCTAGAIFDAVIDLRPDSPSYCRWVGVELSAARGDALYVPSGFAHGFQTLTDDAEVFYLMGKAHVPGAARGVRWNDRLFGISWPLPVSEISERDAGYPDFKP